MVSAMDHLPPFAWRVDGAAMQRARSSVADVDISLFGQEQPFGASGNSHPIYRQIRVSVSVVWQCVARRASTPNRTASRVLSFKNEKIMTVR